MKEVEKLKSSYFAFRSMISIRVRQAEGEKDQMISALKNVIERFKI